MRPDRRAGALAEGFFLPTLLTGNVAALTL